jgi:hypothetical protein
MQSQFGQKAQDSKLRLQKNLSVNQKEVVKRSKLAICAVFKNESPYLSEWIQFHQLAGVDSIILYNDDSNDDFSEVLTPYIESGFLKIRSSRTRFLNRRRQQSQIYNHCLRSERFKADWLAFIDIDEFLFSPTGRKLPEVLAPYLGHPAVLVRWMLFGSGGHVKTSKEPVLERYRQRMTLNSAINDNFFHGNGSTKTSKTSKFPYVTGWSRDGKSLVNPRLVWKMGIHLPRGRARSRTVEENHKPHTWRSAAGTPFSCEILRINHYWSKSIEDLKHKAEIGRVNKAGRPKMNLERLLSRESFLNEQECLEIIQAKQKLLEI